VGWEGTLFMEQIGLPKAGVEFGGGGSSVEINRFFEKNRRRVCFSL
jgi:hypothetical protein